MPEWKMYLGPSWKLISTKGDFLNLMVYVYKNPIANIMLDSEVLKLSPEIGTGIIMLTITTSTQHCPEVLF